MGRVEKEGDDAAKSPWWNSQWAALAAAGLIALATGAAYCNSFSGPFVFDDATSIVENKSIQQLWPIWKPLCPPNHGETVTGRPLLNLSLAVDYAISGLKVWSYHATNLVIHILAALALFGILRRTFLLPSMRDRWGAAAGPIALAITLIWAVHPLQTESVTYVIQRAESLVGLFYLLTLYCFVRGVDSPRAMLLVCRLGGGLPAGDGQQGGHGFCAADGALVRPDFCGRHVSRGLAAALRAVSGPGRHMAVAWVAGGRQRQPRGFGRFWHGSVAGSILARSSGRFFNYLKLCVWPRPLVFDYGVYITHNALEIAACGVVVVLLGLATLVALWRWPKVGFLGAWFFAILAPTSSVIPVATHTIAEHRMYLPLAAVVAGLVVGCCLAGRRLVCLAKGDKGDRHIFLPEGRKMSQSPARVRVLGCCLALAAVVALAIVTLYRNLDYKSDLSIWRDTAAKAEYNPRAFYPGLFIRVAADVLVGGKGPS